LKKNLDILIPIYNEDEVVLTTIQKILNVSTCEYVINICYDYDEDPSLSLIKKKFTNERKLKFIKNESRGFNGALISGIKKTDGDAVLIYMADDHENQEIIDQCYNKFKDGYDLVCPSRYVDGGKMIGNPPIKKFLTTCTSFFLNKIINFPIKDPTNSFRLFSRKFLNEVSFESKKGFTLSFELTAKAYKKKLKMIEIPSVWIERENRKSKFKIFSFISPYLKWLFYIVKASIFKK
jgi:glycosyltransferase involved in cell wall biosynthesis